MAQNARIKLTSISLPKLGDVCDEIMGIGKKTGVKVKGPTLSAPLVDAIV